MYTLGSLTAYSPLTIVALASRTHLELIFLASKIATVIFGYLAPYTTPVVVSSLLFLMSAWILYQHISQMPFRHHSTNLLRGASTLQ